MITSAMDNAVGKEAENQVQPAIETGIVRHPAREIGRGPHDRSPAGVVSQSAKGPKMIGIDTAPTGAGAVTTNHGTEKRTTGMIGAKDTSNAASFTTPLDVLTNQDAPSADTTHYNPLSQPANATSKRIKPQGTAEGVNRSNAPLRRRKRAPENSDTTIPASDAHPSATIPIGERANLTDHESGAIDTVAGLTTSVGAGIPDDDTSAKLGADLATGFEADESSRIETRIPSNTAPAALEGVYVIAEARTCADTGNLIDDNPAAVAEAKRAYLEEAKTFGETYIQFFCSVFDFVHDTETRRLEIAQALDTYSKAVLAQMGFQTGMGGANAILARMEDNHRLMENVPGEKTQFLLRMLYQLESKDPTACRHCSPSDEIAFSEPIRGFPILWISYDKYKQMVNEDGLRDQRGLCLPATQTMPAFILIVMDDRLPESHHLSTGKLFHHEGTHLLDNLICRPGDIAGTFDEIIQAFRNSNPETFAYRSAVAELRAVILGGQMPHINQGTVNILKDYNLVVNTQNALSRAHFCINIADAYGIPRSAFFYPLELAQDFAQLHDNFEALLPQFHPDTDPSPLWDVIAPPEYVYGHYFSPDNTELLSLLQRLLTESGLNLTAEHIMDFTHWVVNHPSCSSLQNMKRAVYQEKRDLKALGYETPDREVIFEMIAQRYEIPVSTLRVLWKISNEYENQLPELANIDLDPINQSTLNDEATPTYRPRTTDTFVIGLINYLYGTRKITSDKDVYFAEIIKSSPELFEAYSRNKSRLLEILTAQAGQATPNERSTTYDEAMQARIYYFDNYIFKHP
jgi:hypothetical protein